MVAAGAARAPAAPTLTGVASGGGQVTVARLQDTATLSATASATGQITFRVFPPTDPTCANVPVATSSVPVSGDGQYVSDQYEPDLVGDYRIVASYSGDGHNAGIATACGDPAQAATVTAASPMLVTTASSSVPVGGSIHDSARVWNVSDIAPSPGDVVFRLYGPGDDDCSLPPLATSSDSTETQRYTSAPYITALPGIYRWVASFTGDALDLPVTGACGDVGESVVVTPLTLLGSQPLTLQASAPTTVGHQIGATATLSFAGNPSGMLTFRAYGPDDDGCQHGAVAASTRSVSGSGAYASDPFTPDLPGVYRFVASYVGDDASTAATQCGDPAAAVAVMPVAGPRPVLDRSFTLKRVSGRILVQEAPPAAAAGSMSARMSSIGFVEVHGEQRVPLGSTVDARAGTARVTTATERATLQSGLFQGSRFVVRQRAANHGLVDLEIRPRVPAAQACAARGAGRTAQAARRHKLPPKVIAKLRARVKGRFRTHGKHSSASAHGTEWLTIERCDGTLTEVISDVVDVRDFARHATIAVHAGHSYFARAAG